MKNFFAKELVSEIRKLRAFKNRDYTFGARVRKKKAGARSCCIPELLALKRLTVNLSLVRDFKDLSLSLPLNPHSVMFGDSLAENVILLWVVVR